MGLNLTRQNAYLTGLIDCPNSFAGQALKFLRVRADELKTEFFEMILIPEGTLVGQTLKWDGTDWALNNDITDIGTSIILGKSDSDYQTTYTLAKNNSVIQSQLIATGSDENSYFEVIPSRVKMFSVDNILGGEGFIQADKGGAHLVGWDSVTSDNSNIDIGFNNIVLQSEDGASTDSISLAITSNNIIANGYTTDKITDNKSLITKEYADNILNSYRIVSANYTTSDTDDIIEADTDGITVIILAYRVYKEITVINTSAGSISIIGMEDTMGTGSAPVGIGNATTASVYVLASDEAKTFVYNGTHWRIKNN